MRRLITIILVLCSLCTFAQKVSVEAAIDSVQILVGEQTQLHLGVTIKDGQRVQFPVFQPQTMLTPGVEIVEVLNTDTSKVDDSFIKVTSHLVLTSFEDSIYSIPSLPVSVDGKKYMSKAIGLKVVTIPVDTLHPNQFFPPNDVQDNPFLWSEWSKLIWLSLLMLLLYAVIFMMYIGLKSNKPIVLNVRVIKYVPPHQKALNSIEKIKEHKETYTIDEAKEYYTKLTDALRRYMNERFGFNAMEMTSSEIIERLRQEKDQSKIEELTMLFETADLVKFAKYNALVSENDRNLISAVDFINTTKLEEQVTEKRIIPAETEAQKQLKRTRIALKWGIAVFTTASVAILTYLIWQLILLLS